MPNQTPTTPTPVRRAEIALWVWTAWTCLFGIYQTWIGIPDIERALTDQLQGMVTIAPEALLEWGIAAYAGMAALSAWIVPKIGAGKHWARSSLMWGVAIEALYTVCAPPHGWDIAAAIPDFGLQLYALYLIYTAPGNKWFDRPMPAG